MTDAAIVAGQIGRRSGPVPALEGADLVLPAATMPGWPQAFARASPVTVITGALRALCLGGPAARPAAQAVTWLAGLLAVAAPAAVARYRHAASS
jgi:oleandomycin transport system permease protein